MRNSRFEELVTETMPEGIWRDLRGTTTRRDPDFEIEITGIERVVIDGNYPWNLLKVETDAGVYGIGEAHPGPVGEYIEFLEPALVGENPLDVDRLVSHMTQVLSNLGGSLGFSQAAVSGIEIALWDLAGKFLDVPAYQLLGGKYRDSIPVYVDCHAGEHVQDSHDLDPRELYSPESYADAAEEVIADGFDALKFDLDIGFGEEDTATRRLTNDAIQHKVDIVDAVRDRVGPDPLVAVDLHWNFSLETATRLVTKLDPYDLAWVEDPSPTENVETYRQLTERTETPILTGENLTRVDGFLPYLTNHAVDLISPDVIKCGGMLELKKIATVAEAFDVPVVPHNLASPIGTIAAAHACASVPNAFALEWHARDLDWWAEMVTDESIIEDGEFVVPDEPGLGVEPDPDTLAENLAEGEELFDL